jgi:hypothetical protein
VLKKGLTNGLHLQPNKTEAIFGKCAYGEDFPYRYIIHMSSLDIDEDRANQLL